MYTCIATCMTTTRDTVRHVFQPKVISRKEAERIANRLYEEWDKLGASDSTGIQDQSGKEEGGTV